MAEDWGLERFRRNDPPILTGRYNPEGAQEWLKEIEKIFRVMRCPGNKKVTFGTHVLTKEAKYWWKNIRPQAEMEERVIN